MSSISRGAVVTASIARKVRSEVDGREVVTRTRLANLDDLVGRPSPARPNNPARCSMPKEQEWQEGYDSGVDDSWAIFRCYALSFLCLRRHKAITQTWCTALALITPMHVHVHHRRVRRLVTNLRRLFLGHFFAHLVSALRLSSLASPVSGPCPSCHRTAPGHQIVEAAGRASRASEAGRCVAPPRRTARRGGDLGELVGEHAAVDVLGSLHLRLRDDVVLRVVERRVEGGDVVAVLVLVAALLEQLVPRMKASMMNEMKMLKNMK